MKTKRAATLRRLTFPALFAISLVFASCDPQTCGVGIIENQSSGTIFLETQSAAGAVDTLAAGQTMTFDPICGIGTGVNAWEVNRYQVVRNRDTICKKDINNDSSWTTLHVQKYKWEHHFRVDDADF